MAIQRGMLSVLWIEYASTLGRVDIEINLDLFGIFWIIKELILQLIFISQDQPKAENKLSSTVPCLQPGQIDFRPSKA